MSLTEQAKSVYDIDYRRTFERAHHGRFVAIEPVSRRAFVADTFVRAALDARAAFPDREPFVLRVGYPSAVMIGAATL